MIKAQIITNVGTLGATLGRVSEKIQLMALFGVAEWLRTVVRNTFTENTSPEGVPWTPLSPKYLARKKGPGMLYESGALFGQVGGPAAAPKIDGNSVILGSNLRYAAAHQFGFEGDVAVRELVRRVKSKDVYGKRMNLELGKMTRVRILLGEGKVSRHFRHMKIPARPYLPSKEFAEAEGSKVARQQALIAMKNEGIEIAE